MGFVWVQDIDSGAVIDAADALEIRTNVDTVDNEKCAAEKVSDQSTNNPSYCNDENTGYLSNDHGTYKSGYLAGVDSSHFPGYDSTYRYSYESGEDSDYRSGADVFYDSINFDIEKDMHNVTVT